MGKLRTDFSTVAIPMGEVKLKGDGLGVFQGRRLGLHGQLGVSLVIEGQDGQMTQEQVWRGNTQDVEEEVVWNGGPKSRSRESRVRESRRRLEREVTLQPTWA